MQTTIKFKLSARDEIRRLQLTPPITFASLTGAARSAFELTAPFTLAFKDADGDVCSIFSDSSVQDALGSAAGMLTVIVNQECEFYRISSSNACPRAQSVPGV